MENHLAALNQRMEKSLESLKEELASIRTGRASTSLLENLVVEVYGSPTPLNQVAALNVPEPRMITVQPWDKSTMKAIEKGIRESDLGLNPMSDGQLIRVPLPELTEERRKDLVKIVSKYGEQAKIAVRNIRRDGIDQFKKMEKNKEISQDDLRQLEKQVQEVTDAKVKLVDEAVSQKEADVMQV
ncbi:MAG: ribosome recycling factor [Magnetococcales bacterium]|nr:ribosome recycling factor [Magnetococcales bacterium]